MVAIDLFLVVLLDKRSLPILFTLKIIQKLYPSVKFKV